MFRALSLISFYFLSQIVFKDLIRKMVSPVLINTSVGVVRFVTKIAVFGLGGAALFTIGLVFIVQEMVRMGMVEGYVFFTPTLVSGLIFFTIGLASVLVVSFTRYLLPEALRVNPKEEGAFFENILSVVQEMVRDVERRSPSTPRGASKPYENPRPRNPPPEPPSPSNQQEGTFH